jgi:hypothetical protein
MQDGGGWRDALAPVFVCSTMISPRARWLAARTRNAARHGLLITGSGAIVMIATLLTFVLLPRQADRAISAAMADLPPLRDTLVLRSQRERADTARQRAEMQRRSAQLALAAGLEITDSIADRTVAAAVSRDSLLRDLLQQVVRARHTPLAESYLALAVAPALQRDETTRTAVLALRDSIERLNRERETYAALSGPDALYALMTSRLTRMGERLVSVAARALSGAAAAAAARPSTDSASLSRPESGTMPLLTSALLADTLLEHVVRLATDSLVRLDTVLAQARRHNDSLELGKASLRARMQVSIPPVAMLLASLVLGLSVGFSVALFRELRRPTVGDAQELEAVTRARVIVHARNEARRFGRRARNGEAPVPVLSFTDDAWPLLHLTLSNIGDMAREVQLLADQPLVAGAVGLNLASVAARESRATVLVDAAQRAGAVASLVPATSLVSATSHGDAAPDDRWDGSRALPLGRDAAVDLLLPRRAREHTRREAPTATAVDTAAHAALASCVAQYDFVVYITDVAAPETVPANADLVLCARLGVTSLAWVTRAVKTAETGGRRVRAVVLWADDLPLAG